MKNRYPIRMILTIMIFITTPLLVSAQNEKSEEEIRKEMMEQEMQEKKKMLEEQQEQMMQWEIQFKEQQKDLEERAREAAREASRVRERTSGTYVLPDGEFYFTLPNRGSQSQLTLRKSFEGTTNVSKGNFEVDENIRQLKCSIRGSVESGEIFIGIEYPDGKSFKELVINSSADISYNQSISIKEGEEKKYVGSWNYVIKTDKAEGHYTLQISTN